MLTWLSRVYKINPPLEGIGSIDSRLYIKNYAIKFEN